MKKLYSSNLPTFLPSKKKNGVTCHVQFHMYVKSYFPMLKVKLEKFYWKPQHNKQISIISNKNALFVLLL